MEQEKAASLPGAVHIQDIIQMRAILGSDEQMDTAHTPDILAALDSIILNFANGLAPTKGS